MLNNFYYEPPSVRQNLQRLIQNSKKLIIYSIDHGFEIGPSVFNTNKDAYDPDYHFDLAINCEFNAITAPKGIIEASIDKYIGKIPTILKINSNNRLSDQNDPYQSINGTVDDALYFGCIGIGFTIYPGSLYTHKMFEELSKIVKEAKSKGLFVVIWAYPRTDNYLDVNTIAYAVHMACLLGGNIIKAKIPKDKTVENLNKIVDSAFNGKRIVLFSGGEISDDILDEISLIEKSNANGSIIGRNFFQRNHNDSLLLAKKIANIYKSSVNQ